MAHERHESTFCRISLLFLDLNGNLTKFDANSKIYFKTIKISCPLGFGFFGLEK